MVSVRKRKMNRSSVKKSTRRVKDKQRKIAIQSNPIIAANWDHNLTFAQNYKKLGLRARLGKETGGVEKEIEKVNEVINELEDEYEEEDEDENNKDENAEEGDPYDPANIPEGTAKLVRDKDGKVVEIIHGTKKIGADAESQKSKPKTEVVRQLEELAQIKTVKERKQSAREENWLKLLYEKYGDDYAKMKWDKKLNPLQHSEGQLKSKMHKWKTTNGIN